MSATSPYDLATAYITCPNRSGFIVGELKGVVIGSAVGVPWGDSMVYASLFYVEEKHRGSHFGKKVAAYMAMTKQTVYGDSMNETLEMYQAFGMKITSLCTVRYGGVAQIQHRDHLQNDLLVKVYCKFNMNTAENFCIQYGCCSTMHEHTFVMSFLCTTTITSTYVNIPKIVQS